VLGCKPEDSVSSSRSEFLQSHTVPIFPPFTAARNADGRQRTQRTAHDGQLTCSSPQRARSDRTGKNPSCRENQTQRRRGRHVTQSPGALLPSVTWRSARPELTRNNTGAATGLRYRFRLSPVGATKLRLLPLVTPSGKRNCGIIQQLAAAGSSANCHLRHDAPIRNWGNGILTVGI
jgi:hypothetical protein